MQLINRIMSSTHQHLMMTISNILIGKNFLKQPKTTTEFLKFSLIFWIKNEAHLIIFNGLIFVDCQQQQQQPQQQYSLKIYPNVGSLSKPSNQKFVITCKGQGGDSNLFSDLYWFTPKNEEINPM